MTIYTSYFYQVRFFPPNLVPLSTAAFDPKWFHDFKGKNYQFKDKRGVINGIRAEIFMPGSDLGGYCSPSCGQVSPNCDFLLRYRAQLNKLDFADVWERFTDLASMVRSREGIEDVNFALMVHEAPTNKCSERVPIQEWFAAHDYPIQEWSRDLT